MTWKEQQLVSDKRHTRMTDEGPSVKAIRKFRTPAYDIPGYCRSKGIDTKGVIGVGQRNTEKVQTEQAGAGDP